MGLGLKDTDVEVESFVEMNCVQQEKEKYLCPLSNKKFKGKEYVRKHIFNKHADKVDIVRRDCLYSNNYVRDANKDGPAEPRYVAKSNASRSDRDRDSRRNERPREDRYSQSRSRDSYQS